MAVCTFCKKEMLRAKGCGANKEIKFPDGSKRASIPYQHDDPKGYPRCHDCNVVIGQPHHPGCDMERCPKCGSQLIGCGCLG